MIGTQTDRQINILYVFGGEKAQGAEIVIERMMRNNAKELNTHLILSPGKFADELLVADPPYKVTVLPDLKKLNRSGTSKFSFLWRGMRNYFTVSWKVQRYVKRHDIDVIHSNTLVPSSYLILLNIYSRVFNKKLKWFWTDHDLKYFSSLDERLSGICLRAYDITFVVSKAVRKKYQDNPKAIVMYNGLNPEEFRPNNTLRLDFREKWHLNTDEAVIGMAASINPDKGPLELISVFSRLFIKFPKIKFVLAGNYAEQFPEYCEQVRIALSATKNASYLGFVANTVEFYNGCDIIVNNSYETRSESLGTTIYEAMACEKLVVASSTGGTPEIIIDKVDGLLFEPENEEDLYSKLEFAIENRVILRNLRFAAREKVKRMFSLTAMSDQYLSILHKTI